MTTCITINLGNDSYLAGGTECICHRWRGREQRHDSRAVRTQSIVFILDIVRTQTVRFGHAKKELHSRYHYDAPGRTVRRKEKGGVIQYQFLRPRSVSTEAASYERRQCLILGRPL